MKRIGLACAISIAALASFTSGARAWDWHVGPPDGAFQHAGNWYVGAGGFGGALYFPRLNGYTAFGSAGNLLGDLSTRHVIAAAGGGLTFGHVLREGMLPPWLGTRVRIEVEGFYRQGSSRDGTSISSITSQFSEINLQGQDVAPGAGSFVVAIPHTIAMSSRIETSGFELALRARSDFVLTSSITLSPSIGVFGGRTADDYAISTIIEAPGVANLNATSTDAPMRTWRFGGDIGADLTFRVNTGMAFHLGGRIGINHVRSSLDASGCVVPTIIAIAPGAACTSVSGAVLSTLSASRSVIGYRASGHVGASFNLFHAVASIGGFVSYDDKAPVFEAQRIVTPGLTQVGTPAGIQFRSALSLGGYASIRIPFGL